MFQKALNGFWNVHRESCRRQGGLKIMLNAGIERSPRVPSKSPMADFRAEARVVFPRIEAARNSELKNRWIWENEE